MTNPMNDLPEVKQARRGLMALRLEVPEAVANDLSALVESALAVVAASSYPPSPRAPTKERLELIVAEVMEKADSRFQFDHVDRKMLEGLMCVAVETTVERLRGASSGSTGAPTLDQPTPTQPGD